MSYSLRGTPTSKYRVDSFIGLNTRDSAFVIEDNEASDALNVIFSQRGVVKKRPGVKINNGWSQASRGKIKQIDQYVRRDGEVFKFVLTTTDFYMVNDTIDAGILFKKDGVAYTHSLTPSSFFHFEDYAYFTNSTDGLFVSTDVLENGQPVFEYVSGIPHCDYGYVRDGRVYYAGDKNVPDRTYISQTLNPKSIENWVYKTDPITGEQETDSSGNPIKTLIGGGRTIDLRSQDVPVKGISEFQDVIIFFKEDSAHGYMMDEASGEVGAIKKLNIAGGVVSPNAICKANNYLYYLSHDGVYRIFSPHAQYIETQPISEKIKNEILSINNIETTKMLYWKSHLYLFTDAKTLVFDDRNNSWTVWDLQVGDAFVDSELDRIIFTSVKSYEHDGYAYELSEALLNDNYLPSGPIPIHCRYSTRFFDFGIPEITKRFRFMKLFFRPTGLEGSTIRLSIEIDNGSKTQFKDVDSYYPSMVWGQGLWGDYYWGAAVDHHSKNTRFGGNGETARFTFEHNRLDEHFEINGLVIGFKPKRRVR